MGLFDRLRKKQPQLQTAGSTGADATFASAKQKSSGTVVAPTATKTTKDKTTKTATATVAAPGNTTSTRHGLLLRPLLTEKTTLTGTYAFAVHQSANKSEIAKAFTAAYGVKPLHVRIMNMAGKRVRWAQRAGKRRDWKKAIIRLPKGSTINVYEGI